MFVLNSYVRSFYVVIKSFNIIRGWSVLEKYFCFEYCLFNYELFVVDKLFLNCEVVLKIFYLFIRISFVFYNCIGVNVIYVCILYGGFIVKLVLLNFVVFN